ncbi:hypothetical protein OIDMADRAFT_17531 [Oidiodendron maius Zn]|uniref:Uncharacterized protein n=1 Tax=Oidiodendron maius (strain Zn) TaxID=913774 RepID=A0A0C3DR08_OIDMZ|nr:hypothetical protein OIDMADRAFT_17531 [Oidiodendron maius Zn]
MFDPFANTIGDLKGRKALNGELKGNFPVVARQEARCWSWSDLTRDGAAKDSRLISNVPPKGASTCKKGRYYTFTYL